MRLARVLARVRRSVRRGQVQVWVLGLLLALVTLTPLADASPPDPLWLAGIYFW